MFFIKLDNFVIKNIQRQYFSLHLCSDYITCGLNEDVYKFIFNGYIGENERNVYYKFYITFIIKTNEDNILEKSYTYLSDLLLFVSYILLDDFVTNSDICHML